MEYPYPYYETFAYSSNAIRSEDHCDTGLGGPDRKILALFRERLARARPTAYRDEFLATKRMMSREAAANNASFDEPPASPSRVVFIEQITFVGQQVKAACHDCCAMSRRKNEVTARSFV